MESHHLVSALLLLLAGCLGSQEIKEDASEEATQRLETLIPSTTASPSVRKLEVATSASNVLPVATSVRVGQIEVFPKGVASTAAVMDESEARNVSLAMAVTTVDSSSVASTEDFAVKNVSSTTGLNENSTAFRTTDFVIIPVKDEVGGSEGPMADQNATDPSTTVNVTSGGDKGKGAPEVTDKGSDRGGDGSTTTKPPGQDTNKDGTGQNTDPSKNNNYKKVTQVIIVGTIIFILILLLALVVFFMMRKKRRSGSFRTNSKKNAKKDVWAGQVPELGDGKAAQNPAQAGNGRAGPEPGEEEEMTTFVTGEKKGDSVVEMNELGSGMKAEANGGQKLGKEEKTPLLEEAEESPKAEEPEEQFPLPPPAEQELMANGTQ